MTLVVKRMLADRLVLIAAFLVVLFAAMLVSGIPIYVDAVAQSGLRERLARASRVDANLEAAVHVSGARRQDALDARVTTAARDVFGTTGGVTLYRSGESDPLSTGGRLVVFAFFDGIGRHARIVSGRWPRSGGGVTEVVVPAPAARELRFRVGDRIAARSRLDTSRAVSARVVGTYRVERPSSVYWWAEPLATTGTDGGSYGPLVTTRNSFFALGLRDVELRWRLQPDLRRLTIGQAAGLRRELPLLPGRLNEGQPPGQQFSVDTNLPEVLAVAARSLQSARAGVLVPSIQLGLLALYGLLFTTGLLIERRVLVTEGIRLRGATAVQIVTTAVAEATLIALPAVAVAPWLAAGSLHSLNHVGPLAGIGLRLEPRVSASSYALAAGAGLVCVAGLALPALRARRVAIARGRRRLPLAGLAQRARLDLVLVALAALGYWQLRRYHGVLVSGREGLGIDPFLVAAPAILLLAGGLLSLRLVPFTAAFVERRVAPTRGIVASLGLRQLARRPRGYARSVLLLVLAVAIGVFAVTYSRTWHTSQVDQAQHAAGADLLVQPGGGGSTPPAIDLASSYRALGARTALPLVTDSFDLGSFGAESGTLFALDARSAAGVVAPRNDFASQPLDELLRPLADGRGSLASVALPGRPTRMALTVQLAIESPVRLKGAPAYDPEPALFLYLRDGDGLLHLYRLPGVAAGGSQRIELDLVHRLPGGEVARPRYPLALAGLELDLNVPNLLSRRATLVTRSLEVAGGTGAPWQHISLGRDVHWRGYSTGFRLSSQEVTYEAAAVETRSVTDNSMRAVLGTGAYLSELSLFAQQEPSTEFFIRPGGDSLPEAIPVLASDSFLAKSQASVGQIVRLALSGGTHAVRIVGSFLRFPTVDPAVPALVADLPTYLDSLFAAGDGVLQPSAWLLRSGRDAGVAERLRAPPFESIDVVSRSERRQALLEDPVSLGVLGALTLGFVAAAAFAAVGFAASATASVRQRTLEFAVLRSLGLRRRQLSAWITLESALVVALSLLGGTGLGLAVSRLVLPYVALGDAGATPVPPVRLVIPWATILALALVLAGTLVAIAAVQIHLVQRLRLAPALRGGEGGSAR